MTAKELQEHIRYASQIVGQWPAWKQNILAHSSEPSNSYPRTPVNNASVSNQVQEKPQDNLD